MASYASSTTVDLFAGEQHFGCLILYGNTDTRLLDKFSWIRIHNGTFLDKSGYQKPGVASYLQYYIGLLDVLSWNHMLYYGFMAIRAGTLEVEPEQIISLTYRAGAGANFFLGD